MTTVTATKKPNVLEYNIVSYLGDSLDCSLTWKSGSTPTDFAGCTAIAQLRANKDDAQPVKSFLVTLGSSTNNIMLSLTSQEILDMGVGKWFYDLQITMGNGKTRTFIYGTLKIIQDVSR